MWRYQYPNRRSPSSRWWCRATRPWCSTLKANDVIHSWWIPKLGGKLDAVPGYENKTWFKATETGTFKGQCAELCGTGHAAMTPRSRSSSRELYKAWVERQKRLIDEARKLAVKQACADSAGGGPVTGTMARPGPPPTPEIIVGGLPERRAGWIDWVTTTDHKKIGILYLFTTACFFLIGGVEALLMRIQLGSPDNTFLDPTTYNQLFTLHGTTMIFMVIVPIAAGFGNFLVPLMIGVARHGVPAPQHALVVAAGRRRRGAVRIDLLGRGLSRLDVLHPAVEQRLPRRRTASTRGSSACT